MLTLAICQVRRALLCLLWLVLACPAALAGQVLHITNGEWAPYMGARLPHFGVASRIVSAAFALQGSTVVYGFFPWQRALMLANTPEWQGGALWLRNAERERDFYYSDPVIDSDYTLFYLKDKPLAWQSVADLRPYRIGITNGYYYGPEFMAALDAGQLKVQSVPTDLQNLRKLLAGRIDVVPLDRVVGLTLTQQAFSAQEAARIRVDDKVLYSQPLYLIAPKSQPGSRAMLDEFNLGLHKLKASGQIERFLGEAQRSAAE